MAGYQFEAISNTSGVLTALANAVVNDTWTVLRNGVDGGTGDPANEAYRHHVLVISNGSQIYAFAFDSLTGAAMRVYALDSYSSASSVEEQASTYLSGNYFSTLGGVCHVAYGATYVYAIVESATASFRHFGAGVMVKNDTYAGGEFLATHLAYPSQNVNNRPFEFAGSTTYVNFDTLAISWGGDGQPIGWHYNRSDRVFPNKSRGGLGSSSALTQSLVSAGNFQFNRQAVLIPIYCEVLRSGGVFYSPVGFPPNIRAVNISYLTDKQEVTLGTDVWKIFPIGERASSSSGLASGTNGLAFLTNP